MNRKLAPEPGARLGLAGPPEIRIVTGHNVMSAPVHPLVVLLGTQLLYTCSDFMGRFYMKKHGFDLGMLTSGWFWAYQGIRQVAMFGQLYIFAHVPLGKTMALLGATSIVLSNVLGLLFLKEMLSPVGYVGVGLAVAAILVLAFR